MKNQHIQCLESVLNPIKEVFCFNSLKEPHSSLSNPQKVFTKIESSLMEFRKSLTNLRGNSINEIMRNLSLILGVGLGSTPESDDIFLGILAAIYCFQMDIRQKFEFLSHFPFERFTTLKSAQLCRRFLKKNFPSEIVPFLNLLKDPLQNDQSKFLFEQEIRKIKTIGTSSGYYFLLGVLWELKRNEKHFCLIKQK